MEWCSLRRHRLRPILSAVHGKMLGEDVFITPLILCVHNRGCTSGTLYTRWDNGVVHMLAGGRVLVVLQRCYPSPCTHPHGTAVSVEAAALPIVPIHSFVNREASPTLSPAFVL